LQNSPGEVSFPRHRRTNEKIRQRHLEDGIDILKDPESFIKAVKLFCEKKKPDEKTKQAVKEIYGKLFVNAKRKLGK